MEKSRKTKAWNHSNVQPVLLFFLGCLSCSAHTVVTPKPVRGVCINHSTVMSVCVNEWTLFMWNKIPSHSACARPPPMRQKCPLLICLSQSHTMGTICHGTESHDDAPQQQEGNGLCPWCVPPSFFHQHHNILLASITFYFC